MHFISITVQTTKYTLSFGNYQADCSVCPAELKINTYAKLIYNETADYGILLIHSLEKAVMIRIA